MASDQALPAGRAGSWNEDLMADTTVQREVERWVVEYGLPAAFGQRFSKAKVPLSWGGEFEFDAVSEDRQLVACVSTSSARTSTGKPAVGKFQKIRADTLFLLHAVDVQRRVLAFTDPSMLEHFEKEQGSRRFPPEEAVQLRLINLPEEISVRLAEARRVASAEVSPRSASDSPSSGAAREQQTAADAQGRSSGGNSRETMYVTYENRHNPHVTIHRDGCGQIRKRGGEHKHKQGEYRNHETLQQATDHANATGLPVVKCSYCKP